VIGGDVNAKIVDVLSKTYGLDRAKVFKDLALPDVRQALQSKEVGALLITMPLAEKYLSLLRGFFQQGPKSLPYWCRSSPPAPSRKPNAPMKVSTCPKARCEVPRPCRRMT